MYRWFFNTQESLDEASKLGYVFATKVPEYNSIPPEGVDKYITKVGSRIYWGDQVLMEKGKEV